MEATSNWAYDKRVIQLQTQILFANSKVVVFGQLVIGLMLFFYLKGKLTQEYLQLWIFALLVIVVFRVLLNYRFNQRQQEITNTNWCRLYALLSLFSGLVWGSAGLLEMDINHFHLLVLVLCGVTTSAMMTTAVYLPASLLFVPAVNGPFIISSLLNTDVRYHAVAWFALAYVGFLLVFLRTTHRSVLESIRLRYENEQLVKDLIQEKDIAEKATERAERENRAKSKFLAAASHDLRQPLHALNLFFDALKLSTTLQEREKLYPNISYSIKSLGELLNALLDISKLDANAVDYRLRPTALGEVIQNITRECEAEAGKKGLRLRSRHCAYTVETDPLWLDRILRNLITNAIRYTDSGGILVGCRKHQAKVVLQVWDTGMGIPEHEQENIFVEFQQLNNPQRDRSQGLGLGLAIVKRLCNLLGHTIEVKSRPGKGSVFSVGIQLSTQQVQADESVTLKLSDNLLGKKVLLIDDEEQVNQAMKVLLKKWGCQVVTVNSQQEAQDKIDKQGFQADVIISDYRLADNQTGVEAIQAITAGQDKIIPAVLITGETAPEQINTIKQNGYKVLHKPVKPASLRIMLNSLCK